MLPKRLDPVFDTYQLLTQINGLVNFLKWPLGKIGITDTFDRNSAMCATDGASVNLSLSHRIKVGISN